MDVFVSIMQISCVGLMAWTLHTLHKVSMLVAVHDVRLKALERKK